MMDVYMTKQAFCSGESVVMPKSLQDWQLYTGLTWGNQSQ